ncbi:hypothetical protein [Corynebacterium silvaticum]|uniref:hypothetical protein n=1 Tax=Corynebacterium silvaticum TaxID=2320431 RepID=UPI001F47508E|nr:hypothetical protein [Corynebacterium silvaticum]
MLKYYDLLSSQRPTVAAVGVFAYKDTLRRLPSGVQYFELVPEPDNPHTTIMQSVLEAAATSWGTSHGNGPQPIGQLLPGSPHPA